MIPCWALKRISDLIVELYRVTVASLMEVNIWLGVMRRRRRESTGKARTALECSRHWDMGSETCGRMKLNTFSA